MSRSSALRVLRLLFARTTVVHVFRHTSGSPSLSGCCAVIENAREVSFEIVCHYISRARLSVPHCCHAGQSLVNKEQPTSDEFLLVFTQCSVNILCPSVGNTYIHINIKTRITVIYVSEHTRKQDGLTSPKATNPLGQGNHLELTSIPRIPKKD